MVRLGRPAGALVSLLIAACAVTDAASDVPEAESALPEVEAPEGPGRVIGSGREDARLDASVAASPADAGPTRDGKPKDDAGGSVAPIDAGAADVRTPPVYAGPPPPAPGEVVFSEIMYDPFGAEPSNEWLELHNTSGAARSLGGLILVDMGNRAHVIAAGTRIAAGERLVLVRSRAAALSALLPAEAIDYEYGESLPDNAGVMLTNGSTGGIRLKDGTRVVAEALYGGWFSMSGGSSIQLRDPSQAASKAGWCLSTNPWAPSAAKGTPGLPNDCP